MSSIVVSGGLALIDEDACHSPGCCCGDLRNHQEVEAVGDLGDTKSGDELYAQREAWLLSELDRFRSEQDRSKLQKVRGFRVSPEEAERLDAITSHLGVDLSTYLRAVALGRLPLAHQLLDALQEVLAACEDLHGRSEAGSLTEDDVAAFRERTEALCRPFIR